MRRSLDALSATLLCIACSEDPQGHSHDVEPSCDTRAETLLPGLVKTSEGGYRFELLGLEPAMPVISTQAPGNVWHVHVTDASGAPVAAAVLNVATFMPDHNHSGPPAVGVAEAPGTYRIESLLFPMPAQYTVTFTLRPSGADAQSVQLMPCLGAQSG
jgi:hypothetical protein